MARTESVTHVAQAKLLEVIIEARQRGGVTIPSERVLTDLLGCSRRTVRKVIARAAEQGELRKAGNTWLVRPPNPANVVSIAVVAEGRSVPRNYVHARVLYHMQAEVENNPAVRIVPHMLQFDAQGLVDQSKLDPIFACDVVCFLDTYTYYRIKDRVPNHSCLLAMDEDILDPRFHVVSLDNYKAGWMAAEYLAKHGGNRFLAVGVDRFYIPFEKRVAGFMDHLATHHPHKPREIALLTHLPVLRYLRDCEALAHRVADEKFDAIFFHSDEGLETFCHTLGQLSYSADIVSMRGDGDLNDHPLPVVGLSHSERRIAEQLLAMIQTLRSGRISERLVVYVPPGMQAMHEEKPRHTTQSNVA
ncbi:MAG: hypothetical protein ACYC26_15085 [Phycisphaerales bacterium]